MSTNNTNWKNNHKSSDKKYYCKKNNYFNEIKNNNKSKKNNKPKVNNYKTNKSYYKPKVKHYNKAFKTKEITYTSSTDSIENKIDNCLKENNYQDVLNKIEEEKVVDDIKYENTYNEGQKNNYDFVNKENNLLYNSNSFEQEMQSIQETEKASFQEGTIEEEYSFEEPVLTKKIKKEDNIEYVLPPKEEIMEEENRKTRPAFLYILGPLLLIIMLLGTTYAFFNYYKEEKREADIVAGDVYVKLSSDTTPSISIAKAYPRTVSEARERTDNYVDFTILSKNTSKTDTVIYDLNLQNGENQTGTRIDKQYLKFDLSILDSNNVETYLMEAVGFDTFNNTDLSAIFNVPIETNEQVSTKYRLRMWISDEVIIGDVAGATYTSNEFNNLYANISLNINTSVTDKSMPLIVRANSSYIENGVSYLIATLTNEYLLAEEGETLEENDTVRVEISSPSNRVVFNYIDNKGNEVTTGLSSIDKTYTFSKNEDVSIKVFMKETNGVALDTTIHFRVTKNGSVVKEYDQIVHVIEEDYCSTNGFSSLADCILVSNTGAQTTRDAKNLIASKGAPNVNTTAPSYMDSEHTIIDVANSEQGLYAVEDDQGTSYIFRGDVKNNNVQFGGYFWKILRINGDGTIRMIFNGGGNSLPADGGKTLGYNASISNSNASGYGSPYEFNIPYTGPTYVGYMYNEAASPTVSNETEHTYLWDFNYYWGESYTTTVGADGVTYFQLSQGENSYPFVQGTLSTMQTAKDGNNVLQLTKTPYTCKATDSASTNCVTLYKVNSITDSTTANVQYITMSPITTDKSVVDTNTKDSNAKHELDTWYANKFMNNSNNGNLVSTYIADNIWCNDRSILSTYKDSDGVNQTISSDYTTGYLLTKNTLFAGRVRLVEAGDLYKFATLRCANVNDKFSSTAAIGNGMLNYPIGLITADETVLAGSKYGEINSDIYLQINSEYATMTPVSYYSNNSYTYIFRVKSDGMLSYNPVNGGYALRPTINLKANVLIDDGDGTASNPYTIQ